MKLLSQALDWLAFVDVAPSSLDLIVRFVVVVNEQTKQGNIADEVDPADNVFNHRSDLSIV